MSEKIKYYSLKRILEYNATYNVIFGERSNGKTYAVLKYAFEEYMKTGHQLAIVRRWDEDFVGAQSARTCYDGLMNNGKGVNDIAKISKGQYTGVEYYAGRYYLTVLDETTQKSKRTDKVIALAFSLTGSEHYKSGSYPNIKYIFFDEFMTRKFYLPNEFTYWTSIVSTIVRINADVKIFMCANTVNKFNCIYFIEMGLTRIKNMEKGQIDLYTYGQSGTTVAVEYSDGVAKSKPSDVYFAFDNPRLKMITQGAWEMDIYPHLPVKYLPKEILFTYFILYHDETLQCEIILHEDLLFTYIHRKTSPLKHTETDIIYTTEYNARSNYYRKITEARTPLQRKIYSFYLNDKVFYQDNEVGEIVRNYLQFCVSDE